MRVTLKLVVGRRGALWIALGVVLAFPLSWVALLFACSSSTTASKRSAA